MNCPKCGKEMKSTSRTKTICTVFCQTDPDEAEYEDVIYTKYRCSECKISYDTESDEWKIPKNIKSTVTDKQNKCISIICNNLDINMPKILSKEEASKFISAHIDESKRISEENKREYDEDDYYFYHGMEGEFH